MNLLMVTERVQLCPLTRDDGDLYAALYGDADVMRHVRAPLEPDEAGRSFAAALRQQQAIPARQRWWTLRSRGHAEPFGLVGLAYRDPGAELGILLHPAWQGRGLAAEAVRMLCAFAFAFNAPRLSLLSARHAEDNLAAARLFTAVAFEPAPTPTPGERHWRLAPADDRPLPASGRRGGAANNPLL